MFQTVWESLYLDTPFTPVDEFSSLVGSIAVDKHHDRVHALCMLHIYDAYILMGHEYQVVQYQFKLQNYSLVDLCSKIWTPTSNHYQNDQGKKTFHFDNNKETFHTILVA